MVMMMRWSKRRSTLLRATVSRRLGAIALQLALDTLAVGRIADRRKDRSNALDEMRALRRLRIVEARLYNVVSKRVAQKKLEA